MAITKETFRTLIHEGHEDILNVDLYDRPFEFEKNGRYVLVGVRQAGKSYMLYKRARQMIIDGFSVENMVYINFDDERLIGMTADDFDLILQAYQSVYEGTPILFFDEIQNVEGWEHFARRLANRKYRVFITGSNAKMLGRDIQTVLGGRFIDAKISPYSFAEFIEVRGIMLQKEWQYGKQRADVQHAFTDYMKWGGFPELLLFKNKRNWLNDLYEKILLGDIIQRNKVKNEMALRLTLKRLAENLMQPISYNRLANLIRSTGVSAAVSSISDYVRYAQEAFLLFSLENYTSKFVEKETVKKHYFIDNGLLSIFLLNNDAALLENLCAIHLHQHYSEEQLYYYNKNIEVDFYIPEEKTAIQACYSLSDLKTAEREINALAKLHSFEPLQKAMIITRDEERAIKHESGLDIEVVPVWKWLLC